MIVLKPEPYSEFACPRCDAAIALSAEQIKVAGMHIYADAVCDHCNFSFYQMLPVGHNVEAAFAAGKEDGQLYYEVPGYEWLSASLLQSLPADNREVAIERRVFRECSEVVILNTLDFLYGHALLKLYNAQFHLDNHKGLGLILMVSKAFEWLVPAGCAEVWIVDLKLHELRKSYTAITEFVSRQYQRFSKIYLSRAYSHPDFTKIDISRYTGIAPFALQDFSATAPRITFILREDRWWHTGILDYWFYRACRRAGYLRSGSRLLSLRQNHLVKSTIKQIKKVLPDAEFFVVGLGKTGSFNGVAHDKRSLKVDSRLEKEWCTIYSKSHVVVGVHGSNMLLPTALAAGCVEVLPEDRWGNMVQDLSVRYSDRRQLFMYRFAEQYASPGLVAGKVTSIIKDYTGYSKRMCQQVYAG